jgi:DNA-binding MarR family transcriptional regulator
MVPPLEELIDEVRLLFNALVQTADRLHASDRITAGQRAVLEYLARIGPATVPDIARSRRVSRQHIQMLVNPLLEQGWIEAAVNPAHRRSSLMRLTTEGERRFRRMRERESALIDRARKRTSDAELRRTAALLRTLRAIVEERGAPALDRKMTRKVASG